MIISQLCKIMQKKERSTSKINKQCLFLDGMAEGKHFLLYTLFLFFNFSTVNIPVFIVSRCLKFILTAKISFILTAKYIKVTKINDLVTAYRQVDTAYGNGHSEYNPFLEKLS